MAPTPVTCFFVSRVLKTIATLSENRIVSKPQIISRLRYVDIVVRPDETQEEKSYRSHYESLQDWNNKYWAENNELFNRLKAEHIRNNFGNITEDEALSHDQLASFYRKFLEQNRDKHVRYNKTWYKNHMALLKSSIIAKWARLRVNLAKMNEIKSVGNS